MNLASDPACVGRLLEIGVLEQLAEVRFREECAPCACCCGDAAVLSYFISFLLGALQLVESVQSEDVDGLCAEAADASEADRNEEAWVLPMAALQAMENIVRVGARKCPAALTESDAFLGARLETLVFDWK